MSITILLLLIIIILLLILVLAIKPARQLFRGVIGLLTAGVFLVAGIIIFSISVYFGWDILKNPLPSQVFWWFELFIGTCFVAIGTGNLSIIIFIFIRLLTMTIKSENEGEFSSLDKIAIPWFLSFLVILLSTFITSSGILIYQTYGLIADGLWRPVSILNFVVFSGNYEGFPDSFAREHEFLYIFLELTTLWIGAILLGVLFGLVYGGISVVQFWIIDKVSGKEVIPPS
jgi:hypothetical protein